MRCVISQNSERLKPCHLEVIYLQDNVQFLLLEILCSNTFIFQITEVRIVSFLSGLFNDSVIC